MNNRIVSLELRDRSVIPAEAEVLVTVVPEVFDGSLELRGRLIGPTCPFATTIEVAYHFRPILAPTARPALTYRAIIPEANLWEPETPFVYAGPIELWHNGVLCDQRVLRHGLRHLSLGPRGLRLNGRLLRLKGREVESLTESEALTLRKEGVNLLVAPMRVTTRGLWDIADRIGFLMLGRVETHVFEDRRSHPSSMGWLMDAAPLARQGILVGTSDEAGTFVTLEASQVGDYQGSRPILIFGRGVEHPLAIGVVE